MSYEVCVYNIISTLLVPLRFVVEASGRKASGKIVTTQIVKRRQLPGDETVTTSSSPLDMDSDDN